MTRPRVAIVGGSIAGCALAIELIRIGCRVIVFERSPSVLDDRGAGISSSRPHLELLRARDLVDVNMPVVDRTTAARCFTIHTDEPEGRVLWEQPISTYGMNWGIFYANLRRRVPDDIYRTNSTITLVEPVNDAEVRLVTDRGDEHVADLVVFADGYSSRGREQMFPNMHMEYGGYVAWRGLIPEGNISPDRPATEMAMHAGGHCVVYYVPGPRGETAIGQRQLNWVWYRTMDDDALADVLVDRSGRKHRTSLPRGAVRSSVVARLHDEARARLRAAAAEVVVATDDPFLQVVYDFRVPSHHVGRMAVIGDAACVARPHTGAGALKATQEAISLAGSIASHQDLDDALAEWAAATKVGTDRVFQLGRVLGRALVTDTPDWATFDEDAMRSWWGSASEGSYVYYADDSVVP